MDPLARKNLFNATEFANASLDYMTDGGFDALEIGNEPNLYRNANRPLKYNISDFVHRWTHYANALSGNLSFPAGPNFWVLSLSSNTDWKVEDGPNAGLSDETGKIKAISQHYYQAFGGDPLQGPLLNHTLAASKTSSAFQRPINYLENRTGPIPFVPGGAGSATSAGHKDYVLQAPLGAAVWTVD